MAEILIVEDDRAVREGLRQLLVGEGYLVRVARDGEDALAKFSDSRPDLILLDVMMPKMNGFKCCEEIRKSDSLLPVVFLTAKDSDSDEVRGMGLGADDYVAKSASDAVLLARVRRALDRSAQLVRAPLESSPSDTLLLGAVEVDFKSFSVSHGRKELSILTKTEADILKLLNSRRGEIVTIDEIIAELRGKGYACEDSMLYVHMFNLRHKLGPAADMIVTKRYAGYSLIK